MNEPERKTFGDYPPVLVKVFPKKEYADRFLAGSIRLGSLYYSRISKMRPDRTLAKAKGPSWLRQNQSPPCTSTGTARLLFSLRRPETCTTTLI